METIFEKYNTTEMNAADGEGEYKVVESFGWSNGTLTWTGDAFGQQLRTLRCGNITAADVEPAARKRSAVPVGKRDARRIEKSF